jgi:hypothetical protein
LIQATNIGDVLMKRMMLFTSILVLAAGCATNRQTSEQARTYQNGYAVTTGPKGKEAATMTAPIITDMQAPPGTAVTTTYPYYVPSIGPKGKEAAAMTLPINPGITPSTTYSGAPGTPVVTISGSAVSTEQKGKEGEEMALPVVPQ